MTDKTIVTGIQDMNGNMIYENDIMLNHGWGDLWLVRWWRGKWMLILINDGEETDLDSVLNFEIVGKFTRPDVLRKEADVLKKEID